MTSQVRHLLSRCRVVDGDDLRIARSRQVLVRRTESNSANWLHETTERMGHLAGAVVEDVHATVLVTRSGHLAIWGLSFELVVMILPADIPPDLQYQHKCQSCPWSRTVRSSAPLSRLH